jgi:hypothetical protein
MQTEFDALITNDTWCLVPQPPGINLVTGKWIIGHKLLADGSLDRYKARWVLRGFIQWPGIDYDETFSPVVMPATVRVVPSLALSQNWPIHLLDVKNTFLHGTLTETVYCMQPSGFVDSSRPDYVCRLNKSLYGLKQAPRAWHTRFASHLLSLVLLRPSQILHCSHITGDETLRICCSMLMTLFSLPRQLGFFNTLLQPFNMSLLLLTWDSFITWCLRRPLRRWSFSLSAAIHS